MYSGVWKSENIQEVAELYRKEDQEKEIKGEKRWITHETPSFDTEIWKNETKSLEKGKAVGPGNLKNEFFMAMKSEEICSKAMAQSFDQIIEGQDIPENWKKSRIKLIKKPIEKGKKNRKRLQAYSPNTSIIQNYDVIH